MFKKVLIANRGEIALRILRACKELGLETVVVHSTADSESMAVRLADESVCIGPGPSTESYLNIVAILSAAEVTGAGAIHPGFGFLSENASFAAAVEEHGLTFIGPDAHKHIATMGNKIQAKKMAESLGFQIIPGSSGAVSGLEEARLTAQRTGYPLLIKAVAGGGGKGMRVVHEATQLEAALMAAQAEALQNFKDGSVYIEKLLSRPRHVEFQVLGDRYGQVVCLGERDCSVQRRHQKIWEEAFCPVLLPAERAQAMECVRNAMKKLGYYSSGTVEFLYEAGQFYFIEMNTRLQVEHPITEMITGIDIVKEQIRIAMGEPLSFHQQDIVFRGHAIECRINAEDPISFMPSPGTVENYLPPGGPFVRVDSALFAGCKVPPFYDSLLAKLVVWGNTREEALARLRKALDEYVITGIHTLIPLHRRLCDLPEMQTGDYDIKWLERYLEESHSN